MIGKKIASAAHSPTPAGAELCPEELGLVHTTIPRNEQLQKARALMIILDFVEQEAETNGFADLSLFAGTARVAAIELVYSLDGNHSDA